MFKKRLLFFLLGAVMVVSAYAALQVNDDSLITSSNSIGTVTVNNESDDIDDNRAATNEVPIVAGTTTTTTPGCVYLDAPNEEAPEWICNPSVVAGELMSAVGSSKSFIPMLRQQKCMAMARLSIAQTLTVGVNKIFQQYANMVDSGNTETLVNKTRVSEQQVNVTLRGTSVIRTATSPMGTYYCLMVMEKGKYEAIAEAAKDDARTSIGDKQALWQQFQALMPIDEMARMLPELEKGNDTDDK